MEGRLGRLEGRLDLEVMLGRLEGRLDLEVMLGRLEGRLDLEGMLGLVEVVLAGVEGFLALGDDEVEGSVPSGGAGVEGVVVLGDDGAGADAAGAICTQTWRTLERDIAQ